MEAPESGGGLVELAEPARRGTPWLRELARDGALEVEGKLYLMGIESRCSLILH